MKVIVSGEAILNDFKYSHHLNLWICKAKAINEWLIMTEKYYSFFVAGLANKVVFDTNNNCQYLHGSKLTMPIAFSRCELQNKQKEIANMKVYPDNLRVYSLN